MENNQQQKLGAGIIIISVIQLVFSGIVMLGLLAMLIAGDKISEAAKVAPTPTSTIIITMTIIIIEIISVILILLKNKLGVYIYFIAVAANMVYTIVSSGFKANILLSLLFPVLMGIFIAQKKEVFGLGTKA